MAQSDLAYYRQRLSEELARAATEPSLSTRSVHEQRAELYRRRIAELGAADRIAVIPLQRHAPSG